MGPPTDHFRQDLADAHHADGDPHQRCREIVGEHVVVDSQILADRRHETACDDAIGTGCARRHESKAEHQDPSELS